LNILTLAVLYQKDAQDNNNNSGDRYQGDNQTPLNSPRANEYGAVDNDPGTSDASESYPPQRRNEPIQSQIFNNSESGSGSRSAVEQPQQPAQDQMNQNSRLSTAKQSFVYFDDASPITCSALFDKCTKKFKSNLIVFNVKLAFLCYFVIPIFCYVDLWLNYTTKKVFFEEMSRKQEALLVGLIFSLLFSKGSLALFVLNSAPMILLSRPVDFRHNRANV